MTDTKTIVEMNRDIAEFEGWEFREVPNEYTEGISIRALFDGQIMWNDSKEYLEKVFLIGYNYHSDWKRLHEAWDKVYKENATEEFANKFIPPMSAALITSNLSEAHRILWEAVEWIQKPKV